MIIKKKYSFLLKKLGVDRTISFTLATQVVGAVRSILLVFLIARYLTPTEQGFYYTFSSILAIQVFFELGFSGIISQYVAHENAHLSWKNELLVGEHKYLSRIASLLHFCLKWYLFASILLFMVLIITGLLFFSYYAPSKEPIDWLFPWIFLSLFSACNVFLIPFIAFYEGLGKVEATARLRFFNLMVTTIIFSLAFLLNLKLFVYVILTACTLLVNILWVTSSSIKTTFYGIWNYDIKTYSINWRKEILPYQAKIALSWMSGYLLFQLFTPILFSTLGPLFAGQMGSSQAILNGILGLANSWINTKIPVFSGLIAREAFIDLDNIFNKTMKQGVFVLLSLLCLFFSLFLTLEYFDVLFIRRFLPFDVFIVFSLSTIFLFVNNSFATYLRCHKKEPFMFLSILSGLSNLLLLFLTKPLHSIMVMSICYVSVMFLSMIWGYFIFIQKRALWHY